MSITLFDVLLNLDLDIIKESGSKTRGCRASSDVALCCL